MPVYTNCEQGEKMYRVEVIWADAWISTDDISIKKAKKLKPVYRSTVGYLIESNETCVVLSTDKFKKGKEISGPMVIPQSMTLEIKDLIDV